MLYISRINDTLGDSKPQDSNYQVRMIRLFEKELSTVATELRHFPNKWNPSVEFVYLGVVLNVYSFCLRCLSTISTSEPEHSIIQSSASQSASQIIKLYAGSLFLPDNTPPFGVRWQLYYPKFYFRFAESALFALLKISALNKLSVSQLNDANESITLCYKTFVACSIGEKDDNARAVKVVETLCKKGIIDQASSNPVQSRLGTSLSYELIVTAVRWRKQHNKNAKQIDYNSDYPSGAATTIADTGVALDTVNFPFDVHAKAFPSDIDIGANYFDFAQQDLGLGGDFNWWG
jgi:hypothetical protein